MGLAEGFGLLLRPCGGEGVALHLGVQLQDQLGQGAVVPPLAHGVGEKLKIGIVLNARIGVLQHPVEAALAHRVCPLLVEDLEVRGELRRLTVFPQKVGAEAVDGADLRAADQGALPSEAGVVGIVRQAARELLRDPAAQLPRGGAGIGDDEKAVNVGGGAGVGDVRHEPLGQHAGLAAAGTGGHQHRAAARIDGRLLGRGGFKFSHGSLPPPS